MFPVFDVIHPIKAVLLVFVFAVFFLRRHSKRLKRNDSVGIIVLGEIGQSPRMMRHALSFADNRWSVSVFAYRGSGPPKALMEHANIRFYSLPEFPQTILSRLPRILFVLFGGPLKALYLSFGLIYMLMSKTRGCSYLMVQNPPAIPTLPVVQFSRLIWGSKLVIDWHNTGYSILALKFDSDQHPMVRLAKWIESKFGKYAHAHLFVTEAEKLFLSKNWGLIGIKKVFYDRPPQSFRPLTVAEIHSFFSRSSFNSDPALTSIYNCDPPLFKETLLTFEDEETNTIKYKPMRPALLVSSTSWTVDEDFTVLVDAISLYARSKRTKKLLPHVLCFITGKGPLKFFYEGLIEKRSTEEKWGDVGIRCKLVWLDDLNDYQMLLGCSDLGISLHQSSSGLDLPMKVVDMYGCGVPVCARNFLCISELVKHGQNGLVFESPIELSQQLEDLLQGFTQSDSAESNSKSKLTKLKEGIHTCKYGVNESKEKLNWNTWEEEWKRTILETLRHQ
ncbi:hypothetical protein O181_053618 [Austropuccinia psidii MF-1]|uniref:Chitobiosyldiphosphodolichol beta-mannosyltransferase n=1 Tax=Austropuccinia psidii MF-1 TaxID=1389203 RepID=A0A9Q3E4P5_9BASI|nr:hypothetical protein [Austropuccinia psidii MF-1]